MSFNTQEVYSFGNSIYLLIDLVSIWGVAQVEAMSLWGNLTTVNLDAHQLRMKVSPDHTIGINVYYCCH